MHGSRHKEHERRIAELARAIGYPQVSASHEVSPLMKLVSRGDPRGGDASLSPIVRRSGDGVAAELRGGRLMFMQSTGGLTDARRFAGRDSILSGPAGGVVGAVRASLAAGFDKIIGFDMGGTSTDVSHFAGARLSDLERAFETQVAGVRMRAPMMSIHTVAAGGGSILHFDGSRYRVGPDSAGANPGPASYRGGGPLTVTDCNLMLGKIQPKFFPAVFGPGGAEPLDDAIAREKFSALADEIRRATGDTRTPEQVAEGFVEIAVGNMAEAIKKISVQRGHDVTEYTLCCFGGAAGQHACLVADALGMKRIFIHPFAGVLSAYGMGLAEQTAMRERTVELALEDADALERSLERLEQGARARVAGPALIAEGTSPTVVEPGWRAELAGAGHLVLERVEPRPERVAIGTRVDPVMLEIFNNLYMSIAEQMGLRLANTAYSVNIKERLDFSCAVFNQHGELIANAPHMPVHLGSMGESIRTVIRENQGRMKPGNVYVLNAPYNGGTHLPDVTVITPVFQRGRILFYVGSRGHHARIGGIHPGRVADGSRVVEEEGGLIDNFLMGEEGRFREKATLALLTSGRYPRRNVQPN